MQAIETRIRVLQVQDPVFRHELTQANDKDARQLLDWNDQPVYHWKTASTRARIEKITDPALRMELNALPEAAARRVLAMEDVARLVQAEQDQTPPGERLQAARALYLARDPEDIPKGSSPKEVIQEARQEVLEAIWAIDQAICQTVYRLYRKVTRKP